MKWIYGEDKITDTITCSYKFHPKEIIAVDLNNRYFVTEHMGTWKYRPEDEDLILKLIGGDEDD